MSTVVIYYEDHRAVCNNVDDWLNEPQDGVQYVVLNEPPPTPHPDRFATGFVACGLNHCQIFTGVDQYTVNNWPVKLGHKISDEKYRELWDIVLADINSQNYGV